MSTPTSERLALAASLALLASCEGNVPKQAERSGWPPTVACGQDGGDRVLECDLEVTEAEGRLRMILRQPDGGFRRIERDGTRWAAVDGAEAVTLARPVGSSVDVRIGGWQYRLPTGAVPQ